MINELQYRLRPQPAVTVIEVTDENIEEVARRTRSATCPGDTIGEHNGKRAVFNPVSPSPLFTVGDFLMFDENDCWLDRFLTLDELEHHYEQVSS